MKEITIYTDGSCINNPGNGGWAAILIYNNTEKIIKGREENTTNNKMELKAVIEALKVLKEACKIQILTDSKYVQLGMTEWIANWIKNNWKNSQKKPVENAHFWQELYQLSLPHKIEWKWVRAHNGDKYNEIVDKIANEEARSL